MPITMEGVSAANHLAGDLAIQLAHQGDGYGTNLATGKDVYSGGPMASDPACSTSPAPTLSYDRSAQGHDLPDTPTPDATISADYRFALFRGMADANIAEAYDGGHIPSPTTSCTRAPTACSTPRLVDGAERALLPAPVVQEPDGHALHG